LQGLLTTNAVELAISKNPEQPGLKLSRHIANFVKKKRTTLCLFESAATLLLGTGKRATLMPEELRL
jgi:hypothetical protein